MRAQPDGAKAVADTRWAWPVWSMGQTRVLLICPDCGHEASERADTLRNLSFYACPADGCDYRFEIMATAPRDYAHSLTVACKKLYAAFHGGTWPRVGPRLR